MAQAVAALPLRPVGVLVDGRDLPPGIAARGLPGSAVIKGDCKSLTIAAASILAKTARDALMRKMDADHPGYGFARHKGYPVREHYAALAKFGACPLHRRSFAPVRTVLGLPPLPPWPGAKEVLEGAEELAEPEDVRAES